MTKKGARRQRQAGRRLAFTILNLGMINCFVFCVPCIRIIISIALFIAQA